MDDSCPPTGDTPYCGTRGSIRVRFERGSGFYREGSVANVAIFREDTSLDDPFTVEYMTNGVTASGNTDYRAIRGTIRFETGQNYRYINIPVFNDSDEQNNEFFQVLLTNLKSSNTAATCDITLATHLGVISNVTSQGDQHELVTDDNSCVCHPTPTPMAPMEISIPWVDYAPPVIKHDGVCYYRTEICRCDAPCTISDPDLVFDTCQECLSGEPLGDEWELCAEMGDEFVLCGVELDIDTQAYNFYSKCTNNQQTN